jgi:hypothetical protein
MKLQESVDVTGYLACCIAGRGILDENILGEALSRVEGLYKGIPHYLPTFDQCTEIDFLPARGDVKHGFCRRLGLSAARFGVIRVLLTLFLTVVPTVRQTLTLNFQTAPISRSLNSTNALPCKGFIRKSAIILSVGHQTIHTSLFATRSAT